MPFYEFSQNNSGGRFTGPAMWVLVEANDHDEANSIAENNGVYFDGCDTGSDCDCCGDRWYRAYRDEGTDVPKLYGQPVDEYLGGPNNHRSSYQDEAPAVMIIFADGHTETR